MEQRCSNWKDFHEILFLEITRKSAEKIQMYQNWKITGTLREYLCTFMVLSRWSRENQNLFCVLYICPEYLAVYVEKFDAARQATVENV